MKEIQADRIITDIEDIAEILKVLQDKTVELSDSQKDELKKLPPSKREDKTKEFIKAAEDEKLQRRMLLLFELENRIKASGLPADSQRELLSILQQAKDNNWKFSPEALEKFEKVKQEENTKKEQEEQKRLEREQKEAEQKTPNNVAEAAAMAVVGATVATAVVTKAATPLVMDTPIAFTENAKKPTENIVMEKAPEKVASVAKKATAIVAEALNKPAKDVTLDDIQRSDKLFNVQKRYARTQYIKEHPALAKDLKVQEEAMVQKAEEKSMRRYIIKEAKRTGKPIPKEYQNYRQNKRPDYTPEEAALIKVVNRIKQKGKALTFDEVKVELSPEQAVAYEKLMRKYHPELFVNQTRETARLALKARLEQRKQQYRMQRMMEKSASLQNRMEAEAPRTNLQQVLETKRQQSNNEQIVHSAVPSIPVDAFTPKTKEQAKEQNEASKRNMKLQDEQKTQEEQKRTTFFKRFRSEQPKNNEQGKFERMKAASRAFVANMLHMR